ncbi:DHH family protein [Cryptosporidium ryanae]|uniref:DHH family protein n=1 Tax=Cryptosporidium ryanae TaxID=515981 RepID=UPI00351AA0DF|nr:DHH family protein [Cryptosporidium ryanae]
MNKELKEYLLYIGRKAGSEVKLNYILGNTSGDLDSVVSAISYSKLLNAVNLPVNFESDVNKKKYGKHIPILNFNKESIRLKFALIELIDYFSEKVEGEPINIVEFPFIFFNDIKTNLINKTKIKLTNSFCVEYCSSLENNVVCIVDHHEDDNTTRSIFRLSKGTRIGSCSTLIGKLILPILTRVYSTKGGVYWIAKYVTGFAKRQMLAMKIALTYTKTDWKIPTETQLYCLKTI